MVRVKRSSSSGPPEGDPGGGRRAKKAAKKRRWVPPPGGGTKPPPARRGQPTGWGPPQDWGDDWHEPQPPPRGSRRAPEPEYYDDYDRGYDGRDGRYGGGRGYDDRYDDRRYGYRGGPPPRRDDHDPYERGYDRRRPEPRYDDRYDEHYPAAPPTRSAHGDPLEPTHETVSDYGTGLPGEPPPGTPGGARIPRKITVTRVAAFRSKQAMRKGAKAFITATNADGADRSGLNRLIYAWMANHAADAALAVALANTLFFAAASAEGKEKVALYLLITVAPFALIAPVIGPLLDRMQRGRRAAMAASFIGRAVLCIVMAMHLEDWLLYPAALGFMVLSKSFTVIKAAAVPRVLPPDITLTKTNSRLAIFGLGAGIAAGAVAGALAFPFGSEGALGFNAVLCVVAVYLCLKIPKWVENTSGEVPATLRSEPAEEYETKRGRQPMGRHVVVALWGNGTTKWLSGFLTLFIAFTVKDESGGSATQQAFQLGAFGASAGLGVLLGNAIGARMSFKRPDQIVAFCVMMGLGACVVAAIIPGLGSAMLCGLLGAGGTSLAKVCIDAVVQRDVPEASRASAFGRSETVLQLSWVFGGAFGVMLPTEYWIGFTVAAIVMGLGLAQTMLARRGGSLFPGFGGDRPLRPDPVPRRGSRRMGRRAQEAPLGPYDQ